MTRAKKPTKPRKTARSGARTSLAAVAAPELIPAGEPPRDLRALARASVDQAEAALDRVEDQTMEAMRFIDEASSAFKRAATEFQLRAFQMAEENAGAALVYWRQLIGLTDVANFADLHRDFAHRQVTAALRQTLELSDLGMKVLTSLPRHPADLKSLGLSD
jgi:hypothetical protein